MNLKLRRQKNKPGLKLPCQYADGHTAPTGRPKSATDDPVPLPELAFAGGSNSFA